MIRSQSTSLVKLENCLSKDEILAATENDAVEIDTLDGEFPLHRLGKITVITSTVRSQVSWTSSST